MRVDWSASQLQTFRDGLFDVITAATGDDYQISETWENLTTPAVVMIGAGWEGHTAKGVTYKLDIFTLYTSQDKNPEAGAEEMMRRVWTGIAYSLSESDPIELGPVTAVQITLGDGGDAVTYPGHTMTLTCSLNLEPPVVED